MRHGHDKDLNLPRGLNAAKGHKPQRVITTITTNKRQRLAVPTTLRTDPALATSQRLQLYLERGDVISTAAATTTSECAGRRSKCKAAELFASTTERLCKRFRQSLTSTSESVIDGADLPINDASNFKAAS